ncbi:tetratricopeptide repeat protein [bacterium]|nr:tetratricopeptide repeat protein [bacterium]
MKRALFALYLIVLVFPLNGYTQEVDSLFSNSLRYNALYNDGDFIDSIYVNNLLRSIETARGEEKIGLLHKLLNGYYFTNPQLTCDLAVKALDIARVESNDSLLAFSLHYLGIAYIYLKQHRLSIDTYTKALATPYAKQKVDYRSWCSMNIANSYFEIGETDNAASFYYQAIKLNEQIGNSALAAKIYDNLGGLFLSTGNHQEANKNLHAAIKLLNPQTDRRLIAGTSSKLSVLKIKQKQTAQARHFFKIALNHATALNDSSIFIEIYSNYANALFEDGQYRSALASFRRGREYCNTKQYPVAYHMFLHGMGKSNLYLGDIGLAAQYLLTAHDGLSGHNLNLEKYELELSLSKLYARTGNWMRFNEHLKQSEKYKSAELESRELATINELKILHETEKKDREIIAGKDQIASQRLQIILIVIIAIILLIGLVTTLILRHKLKQANSILFQKNQDITRRWKQLQHFYQLTQKAQEKTNDISLFTRINRAMAEDKFYTRLELDLEAMARHVHSNVKYVSHAINENAGMNFSTFVNTFRIEEAKACLINDESRNWSMDAIAEQCGFNNPTSFYQAFKKNTGMTPSAFKNANSYTT